MLNAVILMGRLTDNPDYRVTPSGTNICTFTLAVQRDHTPQGQQKQTDFIDCVAWRNTAGYIFKYFSKGQLITVSGSIQKNTYESINGQKRTVVEINVEKAYFTGDKKDDSRLPSADQAAGPDEHTISADDNSGFTEVSDSGDLPF